MAEPRGDGEHQFEFAAVVVVFFIDPPGRVGEGGEVVLRSFFAELLEKLLS